MGNHKVQISIALCTYNGENFLREQLRSLSLQTQLPDEVVVCDDGSTDGTVALLQKFVEEAPFKVRILVNEQTMGVTGNFEKVLLHCEGDILFLCDQDDIWEANKIAEITTFLAQNPSVQVAFSDALLVDEQGKSLSKKLWEIVRLNPSQLHQWHLGNSIQLMLVGNRVAGCTMALRRSFLQTITPFPTHIPDFLHDTWIAFVASLLNQIQFIDSPLVRYRQHPMQQVGTRSKNNTALTFRERIRRPHEAKLTPLKQQYEALNLLYTNLQKVVPSNNKNLKIVAEKLHFLSIRASLPNNRLLRIIPTFKEWRKGNYHLFADQDTTPLGICMTALGDILE
ncbi:MAG: glycosyltransferase family 2 protein [Spirosomataceae bacterium]